MPQETAPDMVLVAGTSWTNPTPNRERDSNYCKWFYISKYEETNGSYLAYVNYLKKYYSETTYQKALPDTTVWLRETNLSADEKNMLFTIYFWHPAFEDFPVVGVSPEQITDYARWKTDRLNQFLLIREAIIEYVEPTDSTNVFTTESYLNGTYYGFNELPSLDQHPRGERIVRIEDGILLPRLRPVLFKEWVCAAYAMGDTSNVYIQTQPETKFKKYNREGHFNYLKITPDKEKNYSPSDPAVGRVYTGETNAHGIYRLYDGVSELIQRDSLAFGVVGGDWRTPVNYAATYHSKGNFNGYYTLPGMVKPPVSVESSATGVYGFRLAMDRVGWD